MKFCEIIKFNIITGVNKDNPQRVNPSNYFLHNCTSKFLF